MRQRKWTPEQDRLLLAMHANRASLDEIAAAIGDGCKAHHIYTRLYRLRNNASIASRRILISEPEWTHEQVVAMNDDFAEAMRRAIKRGRENPLVGVNRKACTGKRAIFVPAHSFTLTQSVAADVAALGSAAGAFA